MAFNLIYGAQVYDFRDFRHSLVSLFTLIFGGGSYDAMESVSPFLTPIIFTVHLFIAGVLFINLLIAMLTLQYENTEKKAAKEWRRDMLYGGMSGVNDNKGKDSGNNMEVIIYRTHIYVCKYFLLAQMQ